MHSVNGKAAEIRTGPCSCNNKRVSGGKWGEPHQLRSLLSHSPTILFLHRSYVTSEAKEESKKAARPPHVHKYRRLLLTKITSRLVVQKLKLQMELVKLWSSAGVTTQVVQRRSFPPNSLKPLTLLASCFLISVSRPPRQAVPLPSMVFLGFLFNTVDMNIGVTPERWSNLLSRSHGTLLNSTITLSNLRSLLCVVISVTAGVCLARIFVRPTQHQWC